MSTSDLKCPHCGGDHPAECHHDINAAAKIIERNLDEIRRLVSDSELWLRHMLTLAQRSGEQKR